MVDAVVRHWLMIVVEEAAGTEGFVRTVYRMASLFYMDDSLLSLTHPEWIKRVFEILVGIFDWVGLRKNVRKMVGMVCHTYHIIGQHSDSAYMCRMT